MATRRNAKGRFVKASRRSNPRRKHRRHNVRRRHVARRRHSNPMRRRSYRRNPRRYVARRRHRNPIGGLMHMVEPALFGAGGALANDILLGYTRGYMPASFQSGLGQDALRLVQGVGLGWLVKKFLIKGSRGDAVAAGILAVATYQLAKDLLVQTVGSGTFPVLGDYEEVTLDNNPAGGGMGSYINGFLPDGSRQAVGAYVDGYLQGEGSHMGGNEF